MHDPEATQRPTTPPQPAVWPPQPASPQQPTQHQQGAEPQPPPAQQQPQVQQQGPAAPQQGPQQQQGPAQHPQGPTQQHPQGPAEQQGPAPQQAQQQGQQQQQGPPQPGQAQQGPAQPAPAPPRSAPPWSQSGGVPPGARQPGTPRPGPNGSGAGTSRPLFRPDGPPGAAVAPGPESPGADEPEGGRRRLALLVAGGIGGLLLVVYVVLIFTAGGNVPGGTSVAGVDIGGLERKEAERRLDAELDGRAGEALRVTVGDEKRSVQPEAAGLDLDIPGTVDKAYVGRTLNPVTLLGALGGGGPVDPVARVDDDELTSALKALAKDTDKQAQEGTIKFRGGKVKAVMPVAGQTLDVGAAAAALEGAYLKLSPDEPVELPITRVAPKVKQAELEQSVAEFAEPAMSGPVTLKIGDDTVEASPAQLAKALSVAPSGGGALEPRLSGKALLKAMKKDLDDVLTKAENATIELAGGKPQVVPGKIGQAVRPKKLAAAVLPTLTETGDKRVAEVPTTTKQPKVTTEEAEGYGIKEVVGEFSTNFPNSSSNYRNINLGRASALINGTLIKPGGTFSLNETVGERTEANGFTTGLVIKGGQLKEELGGGVSQVTTTTYNAAFFAGMEDVEHHPHGFYISRYPVGREATVYWGSLDLKWKNTTPYGVYVEAWIEESTPGSLGTVTVRLWSTDYYDVETKTTERTNIVEPETQYDQSDDCVDQPTGVPGFEVDVIRWLYRKDGELVEKEVDHVTYNPEHNVVCGPDPKKDKG